MAVGAADGSTSIVSLGKIGVKVTLDRNVFVNHNNIVETSQDSFNIYLSKILGLHARKLTLLVRDLE